MSDDKWKNRRPPRDPTKGSPCVPDEAIPPGKVYISSAPVWEMLKKEKKKRDKKIKKALKQLRKLIK